MPITGEQIILLNVKYLKCNFLDRARERLRLYIFINEPSRCKVLLGRYYLIHRLVYLIAISFAFTRHL